MKYKDIRMKVVKTDGTHPTIGAVQEAVKTFHDHKEQVGRKVGWRKTTKAEDKQIMVTFHKFRPPGVGIDSRTIHSNLPRPLKKKIRTSNVVMTSTKM